MRWKSVEDWVLKNTAFVTARLRLRDTGFLQMRLLTARHSVVFIIDGPTSIPGL